MQKPHEYVLMYDMTWLNTYICLKFYITYLGLGNNKNIKNMFPTLLPRSLIYIWIIVYKSIHSYESEFTVKLRHRRPIKAMLFYRFFSVMKVVIPLKVILLGASDISQLVAAFSCVSCHGNPSLAFQSIRYILAMPNYQVYELLCHTAQILLRKLIYKHRNI